MYIFKETRLDFTQRVWNTKWFLLYLSFWTNAPSWATSDTQGLQYKQHLSNPHMVEKNLVVLVPV